MTHPFLKKLKTKKLFFGSWPYKIATRIKGGNYIKIYGLDNVIKNADQYRFYTRRYFIEDQTVVQQLSDKLQEFAVLFKPYADAEIKVRAEGSHFNIFVKDFDLFNKIQKDLAEFVYETYEPENDQQLDILLGNQKCVLCDQLPKGDYRYKLILKDMPEYVRQNFYGWMTKYPSTKIKASPSTERYLKGTRYYMSEPFIYVKDDSMRMMTLLALQGYVRKTEEFVLRSSISSA
jgi:hypothetical protein